MVGRTAGFLLVLIGLTATISAQDSLAVADPCRHVLMKKANIEGLRAIPVLKLPLFLKQVWKCRRTESGKIMLKSMEANQQASDYKAAATFRGWTISHAEITTLAVAMFYFETIFFRK